MISHFRKSRKGYFDRQLISNEMECLPGIFHLENLKQRNWNLFSAIRPRPNLFNVNSISMTISNIINDLSEKQNPLYWRGSLVCYINRIDGD